MSWVGCINNNEKKKNWFGNYTREKDQDGKVAGPSLSNVAGDKLILDNTIYLAGVMKDWLRLAETSNPIYMYGGSKNVLEKAKLQRWGVAQDILPCRHLFPFSEHSVSSSKEENSHSLRRKDDSSQGQFVSRPQMTMQSSDWMGPNPLPCWGRIAKRTPVVHSTSKGVQATTCSGLKSCVAVPLWVTGNEGARYTLCLSCEKDAHTVPMDYRQTCLWWRIRCPKQGYADLSRGEFYRV